MAAAEAVLGAAVDLEAVAGTVVAVAALGAVEAIGTTGATATVAAAAAVNVPTVETGIVRVHGAIGGAVAAVGAVAAGSSRKGPRLTGSKRRTELPPLQRAAWLPRHWPLHQLLQQCHRRVRVPPHHL